MHISIAPQHGSKRLAPAHRRHHQLAFFSAISRRARPRQSRPSNEPKFIERLTWLKAE
jgi:hypothetical protein